METRNRKRSINQNKLFVSFQSVEKRSVFATARMHGCHGCYLCVCQLGNKLLTTCCHHVTEWSTGKGQFGSPPVLGPSHVYFPNAPSTRSFISPDFSEIPFFIKARLNSLQPKLMAISRRSISFPRSQERGTFVMIWLCLWNFNVLILANMTWMNYLYGFSPLVVTHGVPLSEQWSHTYIFRAV